MRVVEVGNFVSQRIFAVIVLNMQFSLQCRSTTNLPCSMDAVLSFVNHIHISSFVYAAPHKGTYCNS